MNFPLVAALSLGLGAGCFGAAAQDTPRELGGAPVLPAPASRPVTARPATPAAADSTRPAATSPTPEAVPTAAQPTYEGPDSPGRPTIGGSSRAGRPTPYQVGLKNGTLYTVSDVEVKSPLFGRSYLQLDGGQRRIELSEVSFYEDQSGHYVRAALAGASHETTLRRERVGRLSLYATYSTSYSPGGFMPGYGYGSYGGYGGYGGYRTTKTEYFSKDNGPIRSLNARNLALATADNAGVQALLAKARNYRTGIILSYVAAGGLLATGFSQSVRANTSGISPVYYAVIPVLVVPLILQSKQAALQRQAIATYNGEQ